MTIHDHIQEVNQSIEQRKAVADDMFRLTNESITFILLSSLLQVMCLSFFEGRSDVMLASTFLTVLCSARALLFARLYQIERSLVSLDINYKESVLSEMREGLYDKPSFDEFD